MVQDKSVNEMALNCNWRHNDDHEDRRGGVNPLTPFSPSPLKRKPRILSLWTTPAIFPSAFGSRIVSFIFRLPPLPIKVTHSFHWPHVCRCLTNDDRHQQQQKLIRWS